MTENVNPRSPRGSCVTKSWADLRVHHSDPLGLCLREGRTSGLPCLSRCYLNMPGVDPMQAKNQILWLFVCLFVYSWSYMYAK